MYAKLENETLVLAPKYLVIEDAKVWNAPAEEYILQGWYPVIYTDTPETEEGYYTESSFVQDGDQITQVWNIVEAEPEIETLFNILLGEE